MDAALPESVILSGQRRLPKPDLDRHAAQAAQGFADLGIGANDAGLFNALYMEVYRAR